MEVKQVPQSAVHDQFFPEEAAQEDVQSVEDILRPLAEATVWEHEDVKGFHVDQDGTPCPSCERHSIPDPRFEALRLPWLDLGGPGIDASLGAIVRAAAACGLDVLRAVLSEVEGALSKGQAPEPPAARALVAAAGT